MPGAHSLKPASVVTPSVAQFGMVQAKGVE